MSGIDEQKHGDIPIPDGELAGRIPDYWCLRDERSRPICWLVSDNAEGLKGENPKWESKFLVNRGRLESNNAWDNNRLSLVTSVESIMPYGYVSYDERFVESIIKELLRIYDSVGYVLNERY
jgi:hypothetical protein